MTRNTIPYASVQRINDVRALVTIDGVDVTPGLARGHAEAVAHAWNATASRLDCGSDYVVEIARTMTLGDACADTTLVVGFDVQAGDVVPMWVRAYADHDGSHVPIFLPEEMECALLESDASVWDACRDAFAASRSAAE